MTTRSFIDKNGNSWEWVETPETIAALNVLHDSTKAVSDTKLRKPHKFNPEA